MSLLCTSASFIVVFLLASALNWLALIPWRRSVGEHWTERARRLYPVRVSVLLNPWFFAVNVALAVQSLLGENLFLWLPPTLAAWAGAALSGYLMDCQIWPGLSFKNWFNQFVLYAMFFQSGLLLVGIAFLAMPPHFGWRTWVIAGVLLAILLSLILGLTVKILCWMHMVQPAPVRLHDIAMRAATRAGVKLHIVWVNQGPLANAFALLPMKDMLFSERMVEAMSDEELDSICAHEASHLTESKWVFIGRLSGVLALYPLIFAFPVAHQIGLPGVLMLLMATVALVFLPRQLARRMEKRADAGAVLQAVDPAVYARALEKIYQTNWMPAAMPRRSRLPHPDLYDRMVAASVTPSYERPQPPGKMSWTTYLLTIALGVQIARTIPLTETSKNAGQNADLPQPPEWKLLLRDTNNSLYTNPPAR
jgi:Zn-dependent protease with chaperone function